MRISSARTLILAAVLAVAVIVPGLAAPGSVSAQAALEVLVSPVSGENTTLDVSWATVSGAEHYLVQHKTGGGSFDDGEETAETAHRLSGLTPGTTYTVRVSAIDTDPDPDVTLATGEASEKTQFLSPISWDGDASVADQTFTVNQEIDTLRLPRVTGGQGTRTFSLSPALPTGLTFGSTQARGRLDGTPTVADAGPPTLYTYRVEDTAGNAIERVFSIGIVGSSSTLTGLTVTPVAGSTGKLDVAWTALSGADRYVVQRRTASGLLDDGVEATGAARQLTGLRPGTTYTVRVSAIDTDPNPDVLLTTAETSGSTLPALGSVTVSPVTNDPTRLDVSWTDVAGNISYVVQWKTGVQSYSAAERNGSAGSNAGGFRITDLTANTAYTVRVTARHTIAGQAADGDSSEGTGTTTSSGLPGLAVRQVSGETTRLDVSWTAYPGADRYLVQHKTGGASFDEGEETTGTAYRLSNLTAATTYTVRVSAIDTDTGSDVALATGEASGTTQSSPPISWLDDSNVADRTYTVDSQIDSLRLPRAAGGTGDLSFSVSPDLPPGLYFDATPARGRIDGKPTEAGTGPPTVYTYRVEDTAGNVLETVFSIAIVSSSSTLTGLTITPVAGSTDMLDVAWTALSGADRYVVQRRTASGSFGDGGETTDVTHRLTGLRPGTTYTVRVSAIDTETDPHALLTTAETSGSTLPALGAITVRPVTGDTTKLDVSWTDVAGNTGYVVQWKTGVQSYSDVERNGSAGANDGTFRITGLTADTTYAVRVTARHTIDGQAADGDSSEGSGATTAPSVTVSNLSLEVGENGGTGDYTVALDAQPSGTVTVSVSSSDTGAATVSPPSLTFTTGNWSDPQTVTVTGVDDDVDNPNDRRTATVTHSATGGGYGGVSVDSVAVTVRDDDGPPVTTPGVTVSRLSLEVGENGGTGDYTVVLDTQPGGTVTISVSSSDTGAATVSASSLTFTTSNWSNPQTVTVTGVNDDVDNPNNRRAATVSHSASGGGYDGVSVASVSVTVRDDDDPPVTTPGVTVSRSALEVGENGGTGSYNVVLDTRPSGTVTISVSSSDTSAATVSASSLSFTTGNWSDPQTVTVTGVNDDVDNQGDRRTATVGHSASGGGYDGVSVGSVSVTVRDDDDAPVTTPGETEPVAPPGESVSEGGLLTWPHAENSDVAYYIEWVVSERQVELTERQRKEPLSKLDEHTWITFDVSEYDNTFVEGEDCDPNGVCQLQLDAFDGDKHYLLRIETSVWEDDGYRFRIDCCTWVRHTPGSDESEGAGSSEPEQGQQEGTGDSEPEQGQSGGTGDSEPEEEQSEPQQAPADSTPAVSFVIYYDPNAGAAAADRYNQATALLTEAGIAYSEVVGDVQDEVDRLAGVTNSIIPRFFLGDPTSPDWVSEPRVNNGGLRWLKQKVAELSDG